ncbi:hypothetical protein Syun_021484 [Stephania yunnanensis]|uniref:P-type ATPase C-terminal domain-containing protein n=1 Tax=Stephania yunnanensis TaxID=152371 RepID=A0AAP0IG34_9MAGN
MCYFFYKNVTFGITVFLFEANTSFSGQPAYNDWYMSLYNVLFTSLPAMALGVFYQDVSPRFCIKVLSQHFLFPLSNTNNNSNAYSITLWSIFDGDRWGFCAIAIPLDDLLGLESCFGCRA